MCNMRMIFSLGLSRLGPLSRSAPQPHMMSDLCSSHQSVTTQTVQQLHNCGFRISVLTSTKSPHLLLSESDLLTHARSAQAPQPISSGHALPPSTSRSLLPVLGSVPLCLALRRRGWAATPSTHSTPPSRLHRTPPVSRIAF